MVRVFFEGQLACGAFVNNAMVVLPNDYGMVELVEAIKELGYVNFMVDGMKKLIRI